MKVNLEINNKTECAVEKKILKKIFRSTIGKTAESDSFADKNISVSVALVDLKEMQLLNSEFRKKNTATDVLSFSDFENLSRKEKKKKDIFLGELVLCCEYIKKSAKINNMSFAEEFGYIFSHGILHLLGMVHGKEMFEIQNWIVTEVFSKGKK
jgi:probable rRNA maturation factor